MAASSTDQQGTDQQNTDQQSTRERILAVLRSSHRAMTTAEVADRIRVHPNTVRFHLDTLIERGQVEQVAAAPQGPGRPAVRVRAIAGMDPQGPRHFQLFAEALTLALAASPDPAGQAQAAGLAWGGRLAADHAAAAPRQDALVTLTEVLDDLGFEPECHGTKEIGLHNCPFLELVDASQEVVCSVHLGLMRGVLDGLPTSTGVDDLVPFARPDLCIAHLSTRPRAA